MASRTKIATVVGLIIAGAGAVFAGIQSWPVISGDVAKSSDVGQHVEQKGGTTNCANVQGGAGTVDCRTMMAAPKADVPEIEFTVHRSIEDRHAIEFFQRNLDKVVRITAHIPHAEAWQHEDTSGFTLGCDPRNFAFEECPAASITMPLKCSTNPDLPCLMNGGGGLVVSGYFTAHSSGFGMGYFGVILRSVAPEAVRLR